MIEVEMLRPTANEMLSGLSAGDRLRRRIQFQAEAVDRLPEIAGEMLSGLRADASLRHRVLVRAERRAHAVAPHTAPTRVMRRLTPAMGMALAIVLMFGIGLYFGANPALPIENLDNGFNTYAAGSTASGGVPQYRALFAGEGANPPLIGIHGRYYRMLASPVPVASALVSSAIAQVDTFTEEPSLSTTIGVYSNVVQTGAQVYALGDLSTKTAVVAEVDGSLRLFQRVGYAANALRGEETFEETLDVLDKVAVLELSGVGVVSDENAVGELVYMLLSDEFAMQHEPLDLDACTQALTVYLKNGLSLQLGVSGDVLVGCGAWVCPDFFSAFEASVD